MVAIHPSALAGRQRFHTPSLSSLSAYFSLSRIGIPLLLLHHSHLFHVYLVENIVYYVYLQYNIMYNTKKKADAAHSK
jgi:hypothetical protein